MPEFGPEVQETLQSHIDDHGFLSWLGVRVEAIEPGRVRLRVPYDETLTNPAIADRDDRRTVHGGVSATLVDTAGGLSVRAGLDDPFGTGLATIDLDVSYLEPATGDLVATGEVVRVGETVGVASVRVASDDAEGESPDVAVGRGSYRIFRG